MKNLKEFLNDKTIADDKKGAMIKSVLNLKTHNSVTKTDLIEISRYLFNLCFDEFDSFNNYQKLIAKNIEEMVIFIHTKSECDCCTEECMNNTNQKLKVEKQTGYCLTGIKQWLASESEE